MDIKALQKIARDIINSKTELSQIEYFLQLEKVVKQFADIVETDKEINSSSKSAFDSFEQIVNYSPNIVLVLANERLVFINPEAKKTLGLTDNYAEQALFSQIFQDQINTIKNRIQIVHLSGEPHKAEIIFTSLSGMRLRASMTIIPVKNSRSEQRTLFIGQDHKVSHKMEEARTAALRLNHTQNEIGEESLIRIALKECERLTESQISFLHFINVEEDAVSSNIWSKNPEKLCDNETINDQFQLHKSGAWSESIHFRRAIIYNGKDKNSIREEESTKPSKKLTVPIFEQDKIVAVIGVCGKQKDYTQTDVDLVSIISENLWAIVRRKRAEIELSRSKDRFSTTFNNIPLLIAEISANEEIRLINNSVLYFFKLNNQKIVGEKLSRLVPENIRRRIMKRVLATLREQKTTEMKDKFFFDGRFIWLRSTTKKITEDAVLIVSQDITSSETSDRKLRESESELKAITENIPDIILRIDKNFKTIYQNENAKKLLGDHFDIKDPYTTEAHEEELRMALLKLVDASIKNLKKFSAILRSSQKGEISFLEWVVIPEQQEPNPSPTFLVIARDVSEQKYTEQQLIVAKEKAEESDRLKSAFLANMSHEIRTPMNGIVGFAEMLNEKVSSEEKRQEYIMHIVKNTNQLLHLITGIIDLSKIESGQIEFMIEKTNLNLELKELYSEYERQIKESGKEIKLILDLGTTDNTAYFRMDITRFKQIMLNLLDNALKFTAKGEIEFGYKIQPNEELVFFVKDSGVGIPEVYHEIIFERFRQIDNNILNKLQSGIGMGLAIARSLVELYGGEMWLESVVGSGSIFYFTYTYSIDDTHPDFIKNIKQEYSPKDNWAGRKILVVDDSAVSQFLLEQMLQPIGFDVTSVALGYEALELVRNTKHFDMVLLDIQLPDLNGFILAQAIKEIRPELPIIAQTAFAFRGGKNKALESGCDDYLIKPIISVQLFQKLHKYLK